ncbi:MAG TPA: response regulator [Desulfobacterales bacterium]|nr:response regulator [Desulfobacterales bacterium]
MGNAEKILVVDDELQICKSVEKILAKSNYQVTHACSAQQALEKLAKESFSLLISDIIMPGKNGLELLKVVKKEWPLTKAVMMTAFASTETAMKSIRLGALDYIPKPFTPKELRSTVDNAISGKLVEAAAPAKERELIDVIDIDAPFEAKEVIEQVGEDYAKMLGRSDMPVVEVKLPAALPNYCEVGTMVCDIFKKLGATCKAGTKSGECPQKKAKKAKPASPGVDTRRLVGIDQPFSYDEVVSVTGPQYAQQLGREGVAYVPYEVLKKNMAARLKADAAQMDVDLPFNRKEVEQYTDVDYTVRLSRSDVPVVEVKVPESMPNYCEVGSMVCDIFKKLGATCKAGTKSGECPQLKSKKAKPAAASPAVDDRKRIGPDWPFDYAEVAAATGADYVRRLSTEGSPVMPYEELKHNMAALRRQPAKTDSPRAAQALHTGRILVVDDEVAVNNNIRKILAKKAYPVDQATSKKDALEMIQTRPYALVLLDLKIPGVNGLELLAAIREQQPTAKVIIITGYASIETAVAGARMGAIDYLPKPFTPEEIRHATENAFRLAA